MSKQIIFCADGTWDGTDQDTNVYKLFKALPMSAGQIAFYDDGVGADGTLLEKLLGGALGDGIFQKIKDGYTKIAHVYEPGDDIFIFGFSRGAYVARSLAGMIGICGLPANSFNNSLVGSLFNAYRFPSLRASTLATLTPIWNLFDAKIKMVGVWDTVGSLGIPALFGGIDQVKYGFLDTSLHPDILNAYHALAIDERRCQFPPTLWDNTTQSGQTLEQVWFAGVHGDIGGEYPEAGLSDIPLSWMLNKAKALGLEIDPGVWSRYGSLAAEHSLDTLHASWSPLWGFPKTRSIPAASRFSNSVAIRMDYADYDPDNIRLEIEPAGGSMLEPVVNQVP